jgi:8-amino-7-oxononanoate synthase
MRAIETRLERWCDELDAQGQRRRLPAESVGVVADFSHNDYLGLARDPELIEAACAAARSHGAGSTGSRLLSGNLALHEALEADIARAKGTDAALVFGTGYQANATVLSALLDKAVLGAEPFVFADRLNHASLHHGCRLAGVHQQRYRHNDMQHLRELLERSREAEGDKPRPRFIVAETVFGMDGDMIDMPALAALADEFDAFLYLDEAHATGVMGRDGYGLASGHIAGRGIAMGTFSKAIGVSGAYIACSNVVRDFLVNRCTGFIYSTANSPAVIGAVHAAWKRLPALAQRREALMQQAQLLRTRLQSLGFDTGASTTHIVPVMVGANDEAVALKHWLHARGILASAIRPPTVPPKTARVRIALSTLHTPAQIYALVSALHDWKCRDQA